MSPTGLVSAAVSLLGNIPHKYDLIMTLRSWPDAQNYCRTVYTDVATVTSANDWLRLNTVAANKNLTTFAWVGLYDDYTSWRWSLDGTQLKDLPYTNWQPGQPNNALSLEACVMMSTSGYWLDTSCTFLRAIICYNGESIF